ncbi:glutathione S-transferase-like isoform X3 [Euwallacea similis]|uniref:glutathione S-transferase-like isoform X3 n=1 Tax=Euwallacea similis TaxID=1736056 RepID=UPI00344F1CD6
MQTSSTRTSASRRTSGRRLRKVPHLGRYQCWKLMGSRSLRATPSPGTSRASLALSARTNGRLCNAIFWWTPSAIFRLVCVTQAMKEPDPIKREEMRARVTKEELPFYLSKFEAVVKDNGGFSVGNSVTWSDLVLAVLLDQFETMYGRASLNSYPSLKGLKETVHAVPSIKSYLEKRPPRSPMPRH